MAKDIKKLIDQFGLREKQEDLLDQMLETTDKERYLNIFRDLPSNKISDMIEGLAKGEIGPESLPSFIREKLGLSVEEAEKMAKTILDEPLKKEEEKPSRPSSQDPYKEPLS